MLNNLTFQYYFDDLRDYIFYEIKENVQDVYEYLCDLKFGKDSFRFTINKTTKEYEYLKQLESMWLNNKLDLYKLYRDEDFKQWLRDKYKLEAYDVLEAYVEE